MTNYIEMPTGLSYLCSLNFPHKIGILERIYGKQLSKNGECWVKSAAQIEWKLDLNDVTQRWIIYDSYEGKNVTAWIRSLFNEGGTAVESGSNIGQTLLYYADLADRIIAIEPLKSALDWLSECKEHNNLSNIELVNAGLASKRTRLMLQKAGAQSTFRSDWYKHKGHQTVEIDCYPLDEIAQLYNLTQVRFWKIDVEGMEVEALQGAHMLLSENRIDAIFIEVTAGNFHNVKNILEGHDYSLYAINERNQLKRIVIPLTENTTVYISLPNQISA